MHIGQFQEAGRQDGVWTIVFAWTVILAKFHLLLESNKIKKNKKTLKIITPGVREMIMMPVGTKR